MLFQILDFKIENTHNKPAENLTIPLDVGQTQHFTHYDLGNPNSRKMFGFLLIKSMLMLYVLEKIFIHTNSCTFCEKIYKLLFKY